MDEKIFRPLNATDEEIVQWAYTPDAQWEEDSDIVLASLGKNVLILKLASDPKCPNRDFFLSCLYILVGDAARTKFRPEDLKPIDELLKKAEKVDDELIARWVKRSRELIASNPPYIDYEKWCDGGWVNEDSKATESDRKL